MDIMQEINMAKIQEKEMDNVSLTEIKNSFDDLCSAVRTLTTSSEDKDRKINSLLDKVNFLEVYIKKKDETIVQLEKRVSDLESFTNEMKRFYT